MVILTKLTKKDFDTILSKYNIGTYKSHKHIDFALQNTIYILKTTKGKYVLKIFEETSPSRIRFQLRIMDYLAAKNIPTAQVQKMHDGKEMLIYKKKRIMVDKFIEGHALSKFTVPLLKNCAKNIAIMNNALLKMKLENKFTSYNVHLKRRHLPVIDGIDLSQAQNELIKKMKAMDTQKLRRSIIHLDIHGNNVLVKNDRIRAIIDWDDAMEDYLAREVAVFLVDIANDKNKMKLFLKTYHQHLKLSPEEKKAVYYFLQSRIFGCIAWCEMQKEIHKTHRNKLKNEQRFFLRQYRKLPPLQEFITYF